MSGLAADDDEVCWKAQIEDDEEASLLQSAGFVRCDHRGSAPLARLPHAIGLEGLDRLLVQSI